MTLVVSDISRFGIIMVGDSAVTRKNFSDQQIITKETAQKIFYHHKLNFGMALWGRITDSYRCHKYNLSEILENYLEETDAQAKPDIDIFGTDLAERLSECHKKFEYNSRKKLDSNSRFGIHLAGYKNGLPRLYHIHCGHNERLYEYPQLYKDFPDHRGWDDDNFQQVLNRTNLPHLHLRNGYIPYFGAIFNQVQGFTESLKVNYDSEFKLPAPNLKSRMLYFKMLVKFVADVLIVSESKTRGVNNRLSVIAFTESGKVEKKIIKTKNNKFSGEYSVYY